MRLSGKVAIITGGAGGIGKETALLFAREGAKVVVQDMNAEGAKAVAGEIGKAGGEAIAVTGDVTKRAECERIVGEAVSKFGRLDILINNAGINKDSMVKKMTEEQWDAVLSVNLKGTFLMCQAALAPMSQAKYGRIVNTASIGALGNIGQANYSASKAGVIGLTCTLALEFARSGIAVNAVSPGATETQMTAGIPAEIKKGIEDRIPAKRFAKPSEIANAHLFLASDDASYVTGQTLFVDGGISVGI
ncbi:MAG: 3-oxoacyl-ACP reductase FabG [Deltaproteobacteria bacterium]|nr:3-oxoacyl-ACP reductase FabG [Deltaproteobacteria bacterium]